MDQLNTFKVWLCLNSVTHRVNWKVSRFAMWKKVG